MVCPWSQHQCCTREIAASRSTQTPPNDENQQCGGTRCGAALLCEETISNCGDYVSRSKWSFRLDPRPIIRHIDYATRCGSYIVRICRAILTDRWQEQEIDHYHANYDYRLRFYTNISSTKDTEVVALLKPAEAGLIVTKRWCHPSGDRLAIFWMVESEMEKVRGVKTTGRNTSRALFFLSWR